MNLSKSARALIGGILWVCIGLFLTIRGLAFWNATESIAPSWLYPALALGLVVGGAKGIFVLRKSAQRMIRRIETGPESAPVWQIYPVYLYIVIPLMIGLGWWLRHQYGATHPSLILGVYVGIGAALIASSIPFFSARSKLSA